MNTLSPLINEVVTLVGMCEERNIPILIGGGLGLFIRDTYLASQRPPNYPRRIDPRTTDDIDCFLAPDVIVSVERMNSLRDVLSILGYKPHVEYLQFKKQIDSFREVKIDLLAGLPDDQSTLTGNAPRVRPRGVQNIHAFRTPEAASIAFEPRAIAVEGQSVRIPASINYLILKLHAFRDRKDTPKANYGRHHALDLFRIITSMDPIDWNTAETFIIEHANDEHVRSARNIRTEFFNTSASLGTLRLRENISFKSDAKVFEDYLESFTHDFRELLPPC